MKLDIIQDWLLDREASYITMTDKVMWYGSPTGKSYDSVWFSMTLAEVVRTINTMHLGGNEKVTQDDIIQVLQELGVVYEMALESAQRTIPTILNLNREFGKSLVENIVLELLGHVLDAGHVGMYLTDLEAITQDVNNKVGGHVYTPKYLKGVVASVCLELGLDVRVGANRVILEARKQRVVLLKNKQPSKLVRVNNEDLTKLIVKSLI